MLFLKWKSNSSCYIFLEIIHWNFFKSHIWIILYQIFAAMTYFRAIRFRIFDLANTPFSISIICNYWLYFMHISWIGSMNNLLSILWQPLQLNLKLILAGIRWLIVFQSVNSIAWYISYERISVLRFLVHSCLVLILGMDIGQKFITKWHLLLIITILIKHLNVPLCIQPFIKINIELLPLFMHVKYYLK